MRDTNQFHIGKFHARAFVAVVQQYIVARLAQLLVQLLARLRYRRRLVSVQGNNGHLEGGDRIRPDDAFVVVVLLNGRCHNAGNANAVAAHVHDHALAVLIQHGGVHGGTVFVAELEDVAHFNATADLEGALAVRARVAFHHVTQVFDPVNGNVTLPVDAGEVIAVAVGAADKVCQVCGAAIHDHGHGQVDRADGAGFAAHRLLDLFIGGHGQRLGHAGQIFRLDLVQGVVAAKNQCHQAGLPVFIRLALYQKGFHGAGCVNVEERGDGFNGALVRRCHVLHGFAGCRAFTGRSDRFGFLDVGGIVTVGAEYDVVFAGGGEHVELVGGAAADRAGIRLDRAVLKPQAIKDGAIGAVHDLVGLIQGLGVQVEGIGILHDELPGPHHTKSGPSLVAEFGLDLVEVGGQFLVAFELVADQVGDDFLVRGSEAEVATVAVVHAQQLATVLGPTSGFLPQFSGLDSRHQHFLGAALVHFFPHNPLYLAQGAKPHRQPGIEAGGQFADHAGAQHQLVADDLGVGGGLSEGG